MSDDAIIAFHPLGKKQIQYSMSMTAMDGVYDNGNTPLQRVEYIQNESGEFAIRTEAKTLKL